MKKYEIMFIVRPDVDENTRNESVKTLEKSLTSNKATITLSKELGQKELAYEIKKCKSGFYYLYNIESNDDAAVKEFDRLARIDENVIRHLSNIYKKSTNIWEHIYLICQWISMGTYSIIHIVKRDTAKVGEPI